MKKLVIAGASVALAAMPVLSTFADTVDYVQLTVSSSCTMSGTSTTTNTDGGRINLGTTTPNGTVDGTGTGASNAGTVMTVTCNSTKGWQLSANASALTMTGGKDINFGAYATSGNSVWSAQIAMGGTDGTSSNVSLTTGWTSFEGAKTGGSAQIIAQDNNAAGIAGVTISPTYKAYVAANQEAGTYTGNIAYTFAEKAGN